MTLTKRRLLLVLAIIIFLIVTPLILFYAVGFNFDLSKNEFVSTGGLYLKIAPKGVKVFIDGELKAENTPYALGSGLFIKDLPEKIYQIEIQKEDYHSWKKEIAVRASLVTEFKSILLLRKKPELVLTKYKNLDEVKGTTKIKNLESILGTKIKKFFVEGSRIFFINDKGKLYQFDDSTSRSAVIESKVIAFAKSGDTVYFLDEKGGLYTKQIGAAESRRLANLDFIPENQEMTALKAANNLVVVKYDTNLFLLNQEKSQFEKIADNVLNFQFDNQGTKIIYLRENRLKNLDLKEIWTYYLENQIQPLTEAKDANLVYSTSSIVENPFFAGPEQEHIVFTKQNEGVLVIEIDLRGGQNVVKFIESREPKIYFQNNVLYFEDKERIFSTVLY